MLCVSICLQRNVGQALGWLFVNYPTKWVFWALSWGLLSPEANHYRIPLRKSLNCGIVGFDQCRQMIRLVLQYWNPNIARRLPSTVHERHRRRRHCKYCTIPTQRSIRPPVHPGTYCVVYRHCLPAAVSPLISTLPLSDLEIFPTTTRPNFSSPLS